MRRPKKFTVIIRPDSEYWYFRLQGGKYASTGIKVLYSGGKPSNEEEAWEFARERWIESLSATPKAAASTEKTLKNYLEPFFVWDKCPHIARVLTDKKRYTKRWAIDQRQRLDEYVLTHPIADKPLKELTPGDFEDWKISLVRKGVGIRTINITLSAVKTAFREGLHRGEIAFNPTQTVGRITEEPENFGIFTLEELKKIFLSPEAWKPLAYNQFSRKAEQETEALYAYAFGLFLAATGERPSAILKVAWRDYSIENETITFRQTKTGKTRTVPIIKKLAAVLLDIKDNSIRINPADLIFCYDSGVPRGYTWFVKRYKAMKKKLELPDQDPDGLKRSPYSFKRSLITHLIDAGEDEILIREYVGHSHAHGETRVLTPVQARYKARQKERLKELLGSIERLF